MNIATLIDRAGGNRRHYAGAFFMRSLPIAGNGFDATVELLRSDTEIYFEGGIVRSANPVPLPFRFSVPFSGIHPTGSRGHLSCPPLGEIDGEVLTTGEGFEFLGHTEHYTMCSLHLQFTGKESFVISGFVRMPDASFAFSAAPKTQWEESAQAKLYALRPKPSRVR
jgi:hypothetical protein